MFLGLAKDRLAGLSVTPTVGFSRHVRTLCLLGFILGANALGLTLLHRHQGALSWAISLLFALDLGVITVEATKAALRCACLCCSVCVMLCVCNLRVIVSESTSRRCFTPTFSTLLLFVLLLLLPLLMLSPPHTTPTAVCLC